MRKLFRVKKVRGKQAKRVGELERTLPVGWKRKADADLIWMVHLEHLATINKSLAEREFQKTFRRKFPATVKAVKFMRFSDSKIAISNYVRMHAKELVREIGASHAWLTKLHNYGAMELRKLDSDRTLSESEKCRLDEPRHDVAGLPMDIPYTRRLKTYLGELGINK